jgi:hypothetical protein
MILATVSNVEDIINSLEDSDFASAPRQRAFPPAGLGGPHSSTPLLVRPYKQVGS